MCCVMFLAVPSPDLQLRRHPAAPSMAVTKLRWVSDLQYAGVQHEDRFNGLKLAVI